MIVKGRAVYAGKRTSSFMGSEGKPVTKVYAQLVDVKDDGESEGVEVGIAEGVRLPSTAFVEVEVTIDLRATKAGFKPNITALQPVGQRAAGKTE